MEVVTGTTLALLARGPSPKPIAEPVDGPVTLACCWAEGGGELGKSNWSSVGYGWAAGGVPLKSAKLKGTVALEAHPTLHKGRSDVCALIKSPPTLLEHNIVLPRLKICVCFQGRTRQTLQPIGKGGQWIVP